MKVLKFGGTSVGTVDALRSLKQVVEGLEEEAVVVVSALGGLTDRLIAAARKAAGGDESYREEHAGFVQRHHDIIDRMVDDAEVRAELTGTIDRLLGELLGVYDDLYASGSVSSSQMDLVVSFGERCSFRIVTAIIRGAESLNSLDIFVTRRYFDRHILDTEKTELNLRRAFEGRLHAGGVTVMPGFISRDESGAITNLGRGGSDYTAAVIAATLGARILEIWTDVDGFMTADPRKIKSARVMPTMTFVEAMDLCNFGAKVIYPPTIYPVFHKDIPIVIKNTFNPGAPGTFISDSAVQAPQGMPVKGVTSMSNSALVKLSGAWLHGSHMGQSARVYNVLGRNGISVFPVRAEGDEPEMKLVVTADVAERARRVLADELAPELMTRRLNEIELVPELATVAVVGKDINGDATIPEQIRRALDEEGIGTQGFGEGGSETSISFLVSAADLERALGAMHRLFFERREEGAKKGILNPQ